MTRGKHAALSANRRYTAAMEHIDRLTSEMADLKIRAKRAEADANAAAGLRREVALLRNDPIVDELVTKVAAALKHHDHAIEAWRKAKPDLKLLFTDAANGFMVDAKCDVEEFIRRRYPRLIAFISHDDEKLVAAFRYHSGGALKLSEQAAQRFERAKGLRGIAEWNEQRDYADIAIDIADAVRMELTPQEFDELLDLTPSRSDIVTRKETGRRYIPSAKRGQS